MELLIVMENKTRKSDGTRERVPFRVAVFAVPFAMSKHEIRDFR